jgi:membrane-associated phospholipid phosphatase
MPGASFNSSATVADLWRRAAACWRLKALLAITVGFAFCVPYFLIGNFPLFPVRRLPLSWLDGAIGFHPYAWVWIYQSEYLIINLIPWFAQRREDLLRYVRGFALLSLISFGVFLLFPIRAPKPPVTHATGMYWLLLQYDVSLNSLPSLHAGMVVYTVAFGRRILRNVLSRWVTLLVLVWAGLILYATLATKEHYAIDILSGALLGLAVDIWTWRRTRGVQQNTPQQRANVPTGIEVMVGSQHGVNFTGKIEKIS